MGMNVNSSERTPRVSVIMAAYGQEEYIREAMESVLNQDFQDWELLVVDDGSPDGVMEVASQLAASDERIKLIRTANGGVSAARNYAAGVAKGELMICLDGDDTIEPTYLRRCVEVFDLNNDVDVVYCQWRYFGAKNVTPDIRYVDYESELLANSIFVTAMIRREAFLRKGGFDAEMRKGIEDWEFWIRFLDENSVVVQLPERLFNYRIKEDSRNAKAHTGIEPFDLQMYILAKHRATYNRFFGAPIQAMGGFREARKYKAKYDKVFYRRFWHAITGKH